MIGLLMLVGIVVTNAIVLLDMVKQRERQGMSTREALLAGGRIRVRPILMTAVATILATLPEAVGASNGSLIAADLGMVVIGGLLSSTLLTLLVIPVLYSLISGLKRRLGFTAPQDERDDFGDMVASNVVARAMGTPRRWPPPKAPALCASRTAPERGRASRGRKGRDDELAGDDASPTTMDYSQGGLNTYRALLLNVCTATRAFTAPTASMKTT